MSILRRAGWRLQPAAGIVGPIADALFTLLAQSEPAFLGDDLLPWLLLAFGAALVAGNVMALVRPPAKRAETDLRRAPVWRSMVMAGIGAVMAVWALASLVVG